MKTGSVMSQELKLIIRIIKKSKSGIKKFKHNPRNLNANYQKPYKTAVFLWHKQSAAGHMSKNHSKWTCCSGWYSFIHFTRTCNIHSSSSYIFDTRLISFLKTTIHHLLSILQAPFRFCRVYDIVANVVSFMLVMAHYVLIPVLPCPGVSGRFHTWSQSVEEL